MKTALITGISGQDGSWMADQLFGLDYSIIGLVRRRASGSSLGNAAHLVEYPKRVRFEYGDLSDAASLRRFVESCDPIDEVYHFAAQSHVGESFKRPTETFLANAVGTLHLFEALSELPSEPRVYSACTSEMFGDATPPQNEATPFSPRSPYAASKIAQFNFGKIFRESCRLRVWNGITFNHESERRGAEFLTRKVTKFVARLAEGHVAGGEKLRLGNLDALRDWGYAPEYCVAFHQMLQGHGERLDGDDFVIATGETHTVRDFVALAFQEIGREWQEHVAIDDALLRPNEVSYLQGDPGKIYRQLGWRATIQLPELIRRMVAHDRYLLQSD